MIVGMITVVVPVYNAEKYIQDTIQSVLNQTYQSFEIVAVNDGSRDHSLEILKRIDDSRLRIINKKNTGVSDTRNVAIQTARGEYICFLDADDCLSPNYLSHMYEAAIKHDADMVVCNYTPFRGKAVFPQKKADAVPVHSTDVLVQAGVLTSAWTKLIRRSVLSNNSIWFEKGMTFGEDLFFCWKAFLASGSVWMIDEPLYGYRMTDGGATRQYHPGLYEKYKAAFIDLKCFSDREHQEMDVFFTTRMPSFLRMTIREKSTMAEKKKRLEYILSDAIIASTLFDWESFVTTIRADEVKFYLDCKNRNISSLLWYGLKSELLGQLSILKCKLMG